MIAALVSYLSEVVTTAVCIQVADDYDFDASPYDQDGKCPAVGSNQVIERIEHRWNLVEKASGKVLDSTCTDEPDESCAWDTFCMDWPGYDQSVDHYAAYAGCFTEESGTVVEPKDFNVKIERIG